MKHNSHNTAATKEKEFFTISPEMKMADLISLNYKVLTVFYRLGIKLGIGEHSVKDVCLENHIDVNSFILICNSYVNEQYLPSEEEMMGCSVDVIVRYLHSSHSYYLNNDFTDMERLLEKLVSPCEDRQKRIIMNFFYEYKKEVENHFAYEEDIVFPYIRSVTEGRKSDGYSIDQFEKNHSNIEEKLNDLKNIVMKYLPSVCDTVLVIRVLGILFSLEGDMSRHTVLENEVLIPMVNILEQNG